LAAELLAAAAMSTALRTGPNQAAQELWRRVEPSTARIMASDRPAGVAVLVGRPGLFLAYEGSLPPGDVLSCLMLDAPIRLRRAGSDEVTQTALLEAMDPLPEKAAVMKVARAQESAQAVVLSVGPNGPQLAQVARPEVAGLVQPQQRYLPFSEVRLEQAASRSGPSGAFTFNAKGEMVGLISALVSPSEPPQSGSFAPRGLSVAYALTPPVLQRVIDGFTSAEREVRHPSIGVFFRQASNGAGVLVESVSSGSPAAESGLRAGDTILSANGREILGPVEFASFLFERGIGETLSLEVRRDSLRMNMKVRVAALALCRA
jgi:hypothetical protein